MALAKGGRAGNQAVSTALAGRHLTRPEKAAAERADGWQGRVEMWLKSRFSMSERKKARDGTGLSYFPKGEIEETGILCSTETFSDN
jgi:hypothetical protein